MRYLLTILFLNSIAFGQTNRYVSNIGSDANAGTLGSPYATIYKALSVAVSGDSILLNSGSTFQGNYTISTSGLNFGSYGTGSKPVVSSLQSKTGFTNVSGNIWTATADSAVTGLNLVYVNGSIAHKARYPNTGWLTFSSYSGDSSITGTLSSGHAGFGIAVRTVPWVIDVSKITSQSGGTLNLFPKLSYTPMYGGDGYFLQGDVSLLDTTGEYSYNDTTKLLSVYSTTSPTVQIATRDTLIHLSNISTISFNNIQFSGANKLLIYSDSLATVTVNNCNLFYSGGNAFLGSNVVGIFNNDSIKNVLNNGLEINNQLQVNNGFRMGHKNKVIGCNFSKIGFIPGMGMNGQTLNGLVIWGDSSTVKYNSFDSTGYTAINFNGRFDSIFYNHISNFAFITSDGGAIYSAIGSDSVNLANLSDSGTIVRGNIIENGIGATAGTTNGVLMNAAAGVYLDESAYAVLVDSNSIYNTFQAGISFHEVRSNTATNNNVYGGANAMCFSLSGSTSRTYANIIKRNQFFANNGQYINYRNVADGNENIDSNYISRWPTEGQFMYNQGTLQTLPVWAGATGWDRHSSITPVNVTLDPVIYYSNPTTTSTTINIGQTYTDFFGNSANSFTLAPYHSIILFKALNQVTPPVPPGKTTSNTLHIKIAQK